MRNTVEGKFETKIVHTVLKCNDISHQWRRDIWDRQTDRRMDRWFSDKLWYLQHICVGDTIVYHQAMKIIVWWILHTGMDGWTDRQDRWSSNHGGACQPIPQYTGKFPHSSLPNFHILETIKWGQSPGSIWKYNLLYGWEQLKPKLTGPCVM